MFMPYSAVTDVTCECVLWSSPRMPGDIHPVVLGSGELGIAIHQLPDTHSIIHVDDATNWNPYIHRDEALSQHHCQQDQGGHKIMPCGWLDDVLSIDGIEYGPRELLHQARNWSRRFTPRNGPAEIVYDIGPGCVTLRCGMKTQNVQMDLQVTCESRDEQPLGGALDDVTQSWQAYFDEGAAVWIGEPDKEYVVLMTQHVLRAGPTGPVRDFIEWLARTCRPAGRPNDHVTYYDGTPADIRDNTEIFFCITVVLWHYSRYSALLNWTTRPHADRCDTTHPCDTVSSTGYAICSIVWM